jgi:hypothetical protein
VPRRALRRSSITRSAPRSKTSATADSVFTRGQAGAARPRTSTPGPRSRIRRTLLRNRVISTSSIGTCFLSIQRSCIASPSPLARFALVARSCGRGACETDADHTRRTSHRLSPNAAFRSRIAPCCPRFHRFTDDSYSVLPAGWPAKTSVPSKFHGCANTRTSPNVWSEVGRHRPAVPDPAMLPGLRRVNLQAAVTSPFYVPGVAGAPHQ